MRLFYHAYSSRVGALLPVASTLVVAFSSFSGDWMQAAAAAQPAAAGRCELLATTATNVYECPICSSSNDNDMTMMMVVTDCLTSCPGFFSTDHVDMKCVDRQLFMPNFWWRDVSTIVLWFVTAGVAMAAGVGGGGIFVPAGILLSAFAPKQSAGLSQASVFGATLGGLVLNLTSQHPMSGRITDHFLSGKFYSRPLIDYDMALYLTPMLMAGAVLGVLIQALLPNWLYLLLAVLVLSFTAHTTFTKYQSTRASEIATESSSQKTTATTTSTSRLVTQNGGPTADSYGATTYQTAASEDPTDDKSTTQDNATMLAAQQRQAFLTKDARQFPTEKVLALLVLWLGLLVLTVLIGGQGVDSPVGITCQSPWYLVLMMSQFVWMLAFAVVYGLKLLSDQRARRAVDYPYLADDVVWDVSVLRFFGTATFVGGIVAGLIGIGGGMVLGPLMLVMGIHPRVSSATTATMMVLTSSSVAIIFVTSGLVPWSYAAVLSGTCFIGSIFGKSIIDGYVKKTGRPSLLVLILAVIIAVATTGCAVILFVHLEEKHWCLDGFNAFCPAVTTATNAAGGGGCVLAAATATTAEVPDFMST